jgi:ABC-2 type transport system ATP-binding protein
MTEENPGAVAAALPLRQERAPVLEIEELEKQYAGSRTKAVNGISFTVGRGEIFGLLGPNGAGKTTTLGIMTTRILPTGGSARLVGIDVVRDPVAVKPHIAVVPQRNNLDRALTALENLTFHAAYFGIGRKERRERAMHLLKQFGLEGREKEKVDTYSGGMAQRLLIARALMHMPDVLFLDEPTRALDPQSRLFLWEMIEALNEQGLTIFLTTHDMDEAARLCRRVAVMDRGKILELDTPENLSRLVPTGTRIELRIQPDDFALTEEIKEQLLADVLSLRGVNSGEWGTARTPGKEPMLRLYAEHGGELAVQAARRVLDAGFALADLHLVKPSLEDVFIHLTGRGLRN